VTIPFLIQLKIPDFITIIISALVAIAAAISQFFQFAERRRIYRQTYEDLKNELTCYEVHGGIYRDLTPEDAFQHFLKQTLKLMNQNVEAFFIVVGKEPTLDLKQHRQEDETM
jgi:Protein of unknown function (DUF4231)